MDCNYWEYSMNIQLESLSFCLPEKFKINPIFYLTLHNFKENKIEKKFFRLLSLVI